jgi:A/G-specific adenine glycosylase
VATRKTGRGRPAAEAAPAASTGAGAGAAGAAIRRKLLRWFHEVKGQREMPWRLTRDPYAVWLSEIMLQQTRVETAIPYYERFLGALPTVAHLAEAPESQVLSLWSGLGYYRRARMLHAAAKQVVADWGGRFPAEADQLRGLPGVGAYTAGAVASIAFGRPAALVDGNVTRVLARLFAVEQDVGRAAGKAVIWELAEALVRQQGGDPGDWNQALMELGATVCTPGRPRCERCPVSAHCKGRDRGIAAGLPNLPPKSRPTAVARVAVVLASSRGVLLARRRPQTLFGGLWEPPSADGSIDALAARLGIDGGRLRRAGEIVHVLSHRRLVVDVLRGPLGSRRRWPLPGPEYESVAVVAFDDLGALAQASLSRRVLELAQVSPRGLLSEGE